MSVPDGDPVTVAGVRVTSPGRVLFDELGLTKKAPEPPLPPGTDIPDPLPHPQPGVPGEIPPTPADDPRPIDDPKPGPAVRDPPPDQTPNPKRY